MANSARRTPRRQRSGKISLHAIVSYDGTDNDLDALALGALLARAGASLTLAYVRHASLAEPGREALEEHAARALLDEGARRLEDLPAECRVVMSPSTAEGLSQLALREAAELLVFGSEYRTAPGHVVPGRTAQTLLEGGPAALALAPVGYHFDEDPQIDRIAVLAEGYDDVTRLGAYELAERLGSEISGDPRTAQLLVVGSRPEAREGHVMISSHAQKTLEEATCPVLVLARDVRLRFPAALALA